MDFTLNEGDLSGSTLLHYMAQYCHYECCSLFLLAGADVNAVTQKAGPKLDHPNANKVYRSPLSEALTYIDYLKRNLGKQFSKSGKSQRFGLCCRVLTLNAEAVVIVQDAERTVNLSKSRGGQESEHTAPGVRTARPRRYTLSESNQSMRNTTQLAHQDRDLAQSLQCVVGTTGLKVQLLELDCIHVSQTTSPSLLEATYRSMRFETFQSSAIGP